MILLIFFGVATALLLLVCCWIFVRCFVRWPMPHERVEYPRGGVYSRCWDQLVALVDDLEREPYEPARILARDGVPLHARYYEFCAGAPTHILLHGYRGSYQDMCGCFKIAKELGHNVLLVSQRAHGKSDGKYLSFGIKESRDCLAWIEYINQRFGAEQPIILKGVSMGAATVMMASELELPENVVGILADCGYSSPEKIIRHVMRKRHYPQLLFPFIRLGGLIFGGFDICSNTPVRALKNCKLPVFFIHGDDDRFVPYEMGRENFEACPAKKYFFTGKNAGHGLSYLVDLEGYRRAHSEFMDEIL